MERVRNARNLVSKRKNVNNLKEANIAEAVLKANSMPVRTKVVGMFMKF